MPEQDRNRLRAEHALKAVEQMTGSKDLGNYVSYVKALPAAVLHNGLGQALATELAAAKGATSSPHRLLYDQLDSWLREGSPDTPFKDAGGKDTVIKLLLRAEQRHYTWAQAEAIAYLEWLKKFAVAFLSDSGSEQR